MNEIGGLFWGIIIGANKKYTVAVKKPFSITMAALDPHHSKKSEKVTLLLKIDAAEHVLCTLVNGSLFQQELDLKFKVGDDIELFTLGKGIVNLTGYFQWNNLDDGEVEEEEKVDKGKMKMVEIEASNPDNKCEIDEKKTVQKNNNKNTVDNNKENTNNQKKEPEQAGIEEDIEDVTDDLLLFRRMFQELSKHFIEQNKPQDVVKLYEDKMAGARPGNREWMKKDMEEMMNYNFDVALKKARISEKNNAFAYEYFYEKALRLRPQCEETIFKVNKLRNEVAISDKLILNRITEKREKYSKLVKNSKTANIDESRFYKVVQTTVAMEGNTFELNEVEQFLKTKKRFPNRSAYEHKEVLDSAYAINFAKKTLFSNHSPITLKNVLDVHQKVTETSQPDIAGKMRVDEDVIVGAHLAPAPEYVSDMMKDFVRSLKLKPKNSHPVKEAAKTHFNFVFIHPFRDGNGRTSRILMNIVLQRNGYPIVDIPMDRQQDYYSSLSMSQDGYYKAFIRFIAECTERTLDEYLSVLDSS